MNVARTLPEYTYFFYQCAASFFESSPHPFFAYFYIVLIYFAKKRKGFL